MPRRPVRIGLWWLGGLGCALVLVLLILFRLGDGSLWPHDKLGVIEIRGLISQAEPYVNQIVNLRGDDSVKAIVLRIDSPGGAIGPSQEIFREVMRTRQTKKIVASLGSVAASGGYYIAAGADKIVANPGTVTGSIGVIMSFGHFDELLRKIGVELDAIKSGRFKDSGSPHRPMSDEERAYFQRLVDSLHEQFVHHVAEARGLDRSKLEGVTDGRILTGEQALDLGLVDKLGNFRDAVETAWSLAGLKGEPEVVYFDQDRLSWLTRWLSKSLSQTAAWIGFGRPHYLMRP